MTSVLMFFLREYIFPFYIENIHLLGTGDIAALISTSISIFNILVIIVTFMHAPLSWIFMHA